MPFPDRFYFNTTGSAISYGDTPSSRFDINRLMRGQPYWVSSTLSQQKKPKTLVLANIHRCTWLMENVTKLQEQLGQLLDNGFSVYYQRDGRLVPLDAEALSGKLFIENTSITYQSDLIKMAVDQLKTPASQLHIVDMYNLRGLLAPEERKTDERCLYLSDVKNEELELFATIIDVLIKSTPPLKYIVDDELLISTANTKKAKLTYLQHSYPDLPILTKYTKVFFGVDSKEEDLRAVLAGLTEATSFNLTHATINPFMLDDVFAAAPHLTKLKIAYDSSGVRGSCIDFPALTKELKDLQQLSLSGFKVSAQALKSVMAASSNLMVLNLDRCKLAEDFTEELTSLPHLKMLHLGRSEINFNNLKLILAATTDLKSLNLNTCQLAGDFPADFPLLAGLTLFDLSRSRVQGNQLRGFLEAMPNLAKLKLSVCDLSRPMTGVELLNLKHLETLDLQSSTITAANLKKLLRAMPGLKTLDLSHTKGLVIDEELNALLQCIDTVIQTEPTRPSNSALVSIRAAAIPEPDPIHSAAAAEKFTEDSPFKYHGINRSLDQGMIIEQLSQYLTLKQTHLAAIPKIQKGICNALSHYFKECSPEAWALFMEKIRGWDGTKETITPELERQMETLYGYVTTYQLSGSIVHPTSYLGDNLGAYLSSCSTPCILKNPWHAISVRRISATSWQLYDPNFVTGVREVSEADLLSTIGRSLGKLVSVESTNASLVPSITQPDAFMENGGLLALTNDENSALMLTELRLPREFSHAALDGILLRNTRGWPAWVIGLNVFSDITSQLLQQFIRAYPDDYKVRLQRSIASLTPIERHSVVENLAVLLRTPGLTDHYPLLTELTTIIREAPKAASHYEHRLQTWVSTTRGSTTLDEYCQQCMAVGDTKKRLIQLAQPEECKALRYALQRHAKNTGRPLFYIDSPADLVCSASYIQRGADGIGVLSRGPGGALHAFLEANRDGKAPILMVNYDHFSAEDLVRFNSLLDKEGRSDGAILPADTMVIGLIDTSKPDCYQGSDFYSRFDTVERCPLRAPILTAAMVIPPLPLETTSGALTIRINLYHSMDWEERLLGRWVLKGTQLVFEEGALAPAIRAGGTIELENAPWEDEAFQQFWHQAFLTGTVGEGRIAIPSTLRLIKREGYNWDYLASSLSIQDRPSRSALVLNPGCFSDFFKRYVCIDNQLHACSGLIEEAATASAGAGEGSILPVHLTRSLSEDEWAMLLSACQAQHVKLEVYCAPGVSLPHVLQHSLSAVAEANITDVAMSSWERRCRDPVVLVRSTDIDTTVSQQLESGEAWTVVDVSECTPGDLLRRIDGRLIEGSPPAFHFEERSSWLLQALSEGKNIILKGHFSPELADELARVALSRMQNDGDAGAGAVPRSGRLVLISDTALPFGYAPVLSHDVSSLEKIVALGDVPPEIKSILAEKAGTLSLSELKAEQYALLRGVAVWAGLHTLPVTLTPEAAFTTSTSLDDAAAFTRERKKQVNEVLLSQPYVFLAGLSGVGKTTFVQDELLEAGDKLYMGEDNIAAWAASEASGRHILFIDEANLSAKGWSEFEGLFNSPPTLLLNGVLHTLSPQHKIVFAGNPASYGDERILAPFFQRHGNTVVFTPLTPAVIYEKILKPVFDHTSLQDSTEALAGPILKVYQRLCSYSTEDVLISPRELQMMGLMIENYLERHPGASMELVAAHIAYQIAAPLVPELHRESFDSECKPVEPLPIERLSVSPRFYITPSRQTIWQAIDDRLALRERRQSEKASNDVQRYGGLGGIILEGEPGVGKSELVIETLLARGYQEMHDPKIPATSDKPFYRLPASMALTEKEALLRKAFNEGAVVVIDEINSAPIMERLLNHLLMGKTPENERPGKPGFMVIATQNPITMTGRRAASTALARRMTSMEVPSYSAEEMQAILIARRLPAIEATPLVEAYLKQRDVARTNHLTPEPTFRDLLKAADDIIRVLPVVDSTRDVAHAARTTVDFREKLSQLRHDITEEGAAPYPGT